MSGFYFSFFFSIKRYVLTMQRWNDVKVEIYFKILYQLKNKEGRKKEKREKMIQSLDNSWVWWGDTETHGIKKISLLLLMCENVHNKIYILKVYKIWEFIYLLYPSLNHIGICLNLKLYFFKEKFICIYSFWWR